MFKFRKYHNTASTIVSTISPPTGVVPITSLMVISTLNMTTRTSVKRKYTHKMNVVLLPVTLDPAPDLCCNKEKLLGLPAAPNTALEYDLM